MYDTLNLYLSAIDVGDTHLMETIPNYLERPKGILEPETGAIVCYCGALGNLKVSVSNMGVSIKDGSLCKWYLGDNLSTMGRGDTQKAIEKLSDTLHLPVGKSKVTRLDVAQNLMVRYPVDVYLHHLGELKSSTRLLEPNGLYYSQRMGRLAFYNKVKEVKNHHEKIPELYQHGHCLRYEMRLTSRLPNQLGVPEVTASLLYDEAFYCKLLQRWRDTYLGIKKINDTQINISAMKSKTDLYKAGILALIEKAGGLSQMQSQIKEAYQMGKITKKQSFDLRRAIDEAAKCDGNITTPNEAILELDEKVRQAVKFFR
jgi:hypothetical protein